MKTVDIEQTVTFHATPEQVYNAIMDSAIHSRFTQTDALIGSKVGDTYSAYGGYVTGEILELQPYHRIVKTWIAKEDNWPETHASEVIFEFNPIDLGTEMKFFHSGIPAENAEAIRKGWYEYYWEPMEEMFLNQK